MCSIVGQPLHLEMNMKMYFPKRILRCYWIFLIANSLHVSSCGQTFRISSGIALWGIRVHQQHYTEISKYILRPYLKEFL